jgi:hypothetical protein
VRINLRAHSDTQPTHTTATHAGIRHPSEATFLDNRPEAAAQRAFADAIDTSPLQAAQQKADATIQTSAYAAAQHERLESLFGPAPTTNSTGLPDHLKAFIQSSSGLSMDDVRVHYNSSRPAQLNALAYARGTDIHIAPGQERHLPHEAWHIVQQAQGRVRPTMQSSGGVPISNDAALEHEADVKGTRALQKGSANIQRKGEESAVAHRPLAAPVVQRRLIYDGVSYGKGSEAKLKELVDLPPWSQSQLESDTPFVPNASRTGWVADVPLEFKRFDFNTTTKQGDRTTGASALDPLTEVGFGETSAERIGPRHPDRRHVTKITIVKQGKLADSHWALQCDVAGGKNPKGMKVDLISVGYRIMYGVKQDNPTYDRVEFTPKAHTSVARVYRAFVEIAKSKGKWAGQNTYNCQDFAMAMLDLLSVNEESSLRDQAEWRSQTKKA